MKKKFNELSIFSVDVFVSQFILLQAKLFLDSFFPVVFVGCCGLVHFPSHPHNKCWNCCN